MDTRSAGHQTFPLQSALAMLDNCGNTVWWNLLLLCIWWIFCCTELPNGYLCLTCSLLRLFFPSMLFELHSHSLRAGWLFLDHYRLFWCYLRRSSYSSSRHDMWVFLAALWDELGGCLKDCSGVPWIYSTHGDVMWDTNLIFVNDCDSHSLPFCSSTVVLG